MIAQCILRQKALHDIPEGVLVVPVVVPKLHFLEEGVQVLHADLVERANDGALEQAPHAFDAVGVHVANHPFIAGMADGLMPGIVVREAKIAPQFVGVDRFGFRFDKFVNEGVQRVLAHVGDAAEPDLPAPLQGSSDPHPLMREDTGAAALPALDVPLAGRQHRFIHFDDADQDRANVHRFQRFPDTVAEVPGRLVGDAQGPADLVRAHRLFAFQHEVDGGEPLPQGQLGVVEDRARRDGEPASAGVAVELVPGADLGDRLRIAAGAVGFPVRPAELFEVVPADLFGAEAMHHVNEAGGLPSVQLLMLPGVGLVDRISGGGHG